VGNFDGLLTGGDEGLEKLKRKRKRSNKTISIDRAR
jgi:hypothetical protein